MWIIQVVLRQAQMFFHQQLVGRSMISSRFLKCFRGNVHMACLSEKPVQLSLKYLGAYTKGISSLDAKVNWYSVFLNCLVSSWLLWRPFCVSCTCQSFSAWWVIFLALPSIPSILTHNYYVGSWNRQPELILAIWFLNSYLPFALQWAVAI